MNYTTYAPGRKMAAFIKCFWALESPVASHPEKQRIVPDGCMEMIFHYGDGFRQYGAGESFIIQPKCFVFGQVTTPLDIEPTGTTGIFAARFQPGGFTPFSSLPVKDMENRAVPISELFGWEGTLLEEKILNTLTHEERISIIENFLLERLEGTGETDHTAQSSVAILMQLNGQVLVEELAEQLKINRRQLERKFSSAIGLSPKQLAKIIRLQATLKMLEKKQFTSLTSLAYENGYFDQTHFIKDFKEVTGMSPKQFYAGNLKMSALFIGGD